MVRAAPGSRLRTTGVYVYPRGICKVCGKECRVRRDGTIGGHGYNRYWPQWCQGSLQKGWKVGSVPAHLGNLERSLDDIT